METHKVIVEFKEVVCSDHYCVDHKHLNRVISCTCGAKDIATSAEGVRSWFKSHEEKVIKDKLGLEFILE